jgi:hypothetical protein
MQGSQFRFFEFLAVKMMSVTALSGLTHLA